ncbi:MAG TPA: energy transducer TonB [Steroidobacteraceae bacterium]|nr:energy transducer TonB [Steroidobacteraceae bacterium]
MVSAASASRTSDAAAPAAAVKASQPTTDVTAITNRDEFLLELGQALGGQAAVRPVETLEAALAAMAGSKRAQVLVIDAGTLPNARAAVDAACAAQPRAAVVVFAATAGEKQLATTLKGSKVFAVLPTPIDVRKTEAVLSGAIAAAETNKAAAAATPAPTPPLTIGALRPPAAPPGARSGADNTRRTLLAVAAVALLAAAAGGAWWFFQGRQPVAAAAHPATAPASGATVAAPPLADTSILQGKVDELLEKARLAMHERRFTEPAGDNALLYYRSAVAANANNAEARDGLQRVAAVLAGRFDEAVNGGRLDEAAQTLANLKSAAPADARVAAGELRLYGAQIAKAIADGNLDRAAALVHQAQQSSSIPAEQLARWRADITHRQEDARVQHLAGLVDDRIRDGHLDDPQDSARSYLLELQSAAPGNAATQRAAHALLSAYLHKARDAALAKNTAEQQRWLDAARRAGLTPAEVIEFEKDVAAARQKAAQADSERMLQAARERLRDGRLTDPAQDSAAYYLTQLQSSDPGNAALADAGRALAARLIERARAAVLAGKPADADLALAKRWGADPKDLAAVQQLQPPPPQAAVDPATLAANLKRVRSAPPDYPPTALAQHVSGSVTLEFTVSVRGETRDIHVLESLPTGVFDQAAINAVKHWRYAPMVVDGAAVEVPVKTRMRFELPK